MTAPTIAPAETPTDTGDELNHYWCHNPNVAFCGADLSEHAENNFDDNDPSVCVVCRDLLAVPCEVCC